MKKIALVFISLLFLVSCGEKITSNWKEVISWMKDNKSFVCNMEINNEKLEFWYKNNESFKFISKDPKEGNMLLKKWILYNWTTKDELGKEIPNLFSGNIGDELLQQMEDLLQKWGEKAKILCTQKSISDEDFNIPSDIKFPSQMTSEEIKRFLSEQDNIEMNKKLTQEFQKIKRQKSYLSLQADTIIEDFEKDSEQADIDYYKWEDAFIEITGKIFDIEDRYINPKTYKEEENNNNKQLNTIIFKNKDNKLSIRVVFFDYFNELNDDERWKKNKSLKKNDIITVKCKFNNSFGGHKVSFNNCILLENK